MTTSMTFAPGWVQHIDPANERRDLLTYINDTHKAVYGYRPRWDREWADTVSIDVLRKDAADLESAVYTEIERDRAEEARRQQEMADHHMAVAAAMKPVSPTHKPFANLKESLCL